jgi:hypothetical protein
MGEGGEHSNARAQTRAPTACMGGGREGDGGSDDLHAPPTSLHLLCSMMDSLPAGN